MIDAILNALRGTPWLVWIAFAYLLFIGINALKPSIKPIQNILIMPTIFLILSLQGLLKALKATNIAIWALALITGIALGLLLIKKMTIKADKAHHLIALPGTKITLLVILAIFTVKYYFGYQIAVHPELIHNFAFNFARLGIFALITGLSVGRTVSLLYKYQKALHTDLSNKLIRQLFLR